MADPAALAGDRTNETSLLPKLPDNPTPKAVQRWAREIKSFLRFATTDKVTTDASRTQAVARLFFSIVGNIKDEALAESLDEWLEENLANGTIFSEMCAQNPRVPGVAAVAADPAAAPPVVAVNAVAPIDWDVSAIQNSVWTFYTGIRKVVSWVEQERDPVEVSSLLNAVAQKKACQNTQGLDGIISFKQKKSMIDIRIRRLRDRLSLDDDVTYRNVEEALLHLSSMNLSDNDLTNVLHSYTEEIKVLTIAKIDKLLTSAISKHAIAKEQRISKGSVSVIAMVHDEDLQDVDSIDDDALYETQICAIADHAADDDSEYHEIIAALRDRKKKRSFPVSGRTGGKGNNRSNQRNRTSFRSSRRQSGNQNFSNPGAASQRNAQGKIVKASMTAEQAYGKGVCMICGAHDHKVLGCQHATPQCKARAMADMKFMLRKKLQIKAITADTHDTIIAAIDSHLNTICCENDISLDDISNMIASIEISDDADTILDGLLAVEPDTSAEMFDFSSDDIFDFEAKPVTALSSLQADSIHDLPTANTSAPLRSPKMIHASTVEAEAYALACSQREGAAIKSILDEIAPVHAPCHHIEQSPTTEDNVTVYDSVAHITRIQTKILKSSCDPDDATFAELFPEHGRLIFDMYHACAQFDFTAFHTWRSRVYPGLSFSDFPRIASPAGYLWIQDPLRLNHVPTYHISADTTTSTPVSNLADVSTKIPETPKRRLISRGNPTSVTITHPSPLLTLNTELEDEIRDFVQTHDFRLSKKLSAKKRSLKRKTAHEQANKSRSFQASTLHGLKEWHALEEFVAVFDAHARSQAYEDFTNVFDAHIFPDPLGTISDFCATFDPHAPTNLFRRVFPEDPVEFARLFRRSVDSRTERVIATPKKIPRMSADQRRTRKAINAALSSDPFQGLQFDIAAVAPRSSPIKADRNNPLHVAVDSGAIDSVASAHEASRLARAAEDLTGQSAFVTDIATRNYRGVGNASLVATTSQAVPLPGGGSIGFRVLEDTKQAPLLGQPALQKLGVISDWFNDRYLSVHDPETLVTDNDDGTTTIRGRFHHHKVKANGHRAVDLADINTSSNIASATGLSFAFVTDYHVCSQAFILILTPSDVYAINVPQIDPSDKKFEHKRSSIFAKTIRHWFDSLSCDQPDIVLVDQHRCPMFLDFYPPKNTIQIDLAPAPNVVYQIADLVVHTMLSQSSPDSSAAASHVSSKYNFDFPDFH